MGACAKDGWEALEAVHAGKASCPSTLCGLSFNYFERGATSLPSRAVRQQLGLTRREQQLIPLIAGGPTNKEIANRFCLSEQTVKNHLCLMKHKVGADNQLGIVPTCHTQRFLL
jgi:two-component system, NarL family, nitrate/nitrite response regulator NarL